MCRPSMAGRGFLPFLMCFSCSILLQLSSATAMARGRETDRLALLAFKYQIHQDPSGALSSWNDSNDFCKWEGVQCSSKHLNRVTVLNLSSRGLAGSISPSIANLTFLRSLLLMENSFTGLIPPTITQLHRLQHLNLSHNSLQGEIPRNLSYCQNLEIFSVMDNSLVGNIPAQLGSLPKLSVLGLSHNNLTGGIPPSLANISTLAFVSAMSNYLEGSIPEDFGCRSRLMFLQLSANRLSGPIPPCIFNISSLHYLALAANELEGGQLPPDIGNTLPNLTYLILGACQFRGPLPASLANASRLSFMDLAENNFSGQVPSDLGRLQHLGSLNLETNQLEASDASSWRFLDSLSNCSRLQLLSMSQNRLSGKLPSSVANLSTELQQILLGENQITGSIHPGVENLTNLYMLNVEDNLLTGTIPKGIGKLKNLQVLELFDNRFTGDIPSSLGNLSQLNYLVLSSNQLEGHIPSSLGNLSQLILLELSKNRLSSTIPREIFRLPFLSRYIDLSNNNLEGTLPADVGNLANVEGIILSGNKLAGEIPNTIGKCQSLQNLMMDNNLFHGSIPYSLSNIKNLQMLNLSHNYLSGPFPEFLGNLKFLFYVDLSFNHLQGVVPKKGIFQNATATSLHGNSGLCGGVPELNLPSCNVESSQRKGRGSLWLKLLIPLAGAVLCLLILALFIYLKFKRKPRLETSLVTSSDDRYPRVSYRELVKATDNFSSTNLLGKGRYGSVYIGTLGSNNATVAVKVYNLQQKGGTKSFTAECEALRSIRHRNLIKVLTSCSSVDSRRHAFRALIFEFMPNGSLERWLHPQENTDHELDHLTLIQRLNITIDVANALDYLHHDCQPPIIHCDLKPSNILLDNNMTARVGDFGIAKFFTEATPQPSRDLDSSSGIRGTIGYVPPGNFQPFLLQLSNTYDSFKLIYVFFNLQIFV